MNISLLYNYFLGETSPLFAARVDSQAYEMGARRMENFIPMLTGGLRKRPGTWFDGNTEENKEARLIDWLLSDGTCVILELTAGVTRVWRDSRDIIEEEPDDEQIDEEISEPEEPEDGDDSEDESGEEDIEEEKENEDIDEDLELPEPGDYQYRIIQRKPNIYTKKQIQSLHYAASANSLWLVHPEQPPMKLTWNGKKVIKSFPEFEGKDFTAENDRPGAIAFDAGRLCFAGTKNEPNRIYMSKAPNSQTGESRYTDFTTGDNPADAIVLEENDMHGSRIQWIAANRNLLAATERATWSDTGEVPTPATFDMNIIEYAGANEQQARGTKEIMVYAGRDGKTLRALVWNQSDQGSGFVDMDISEQAAHLFSARIKDFAVADYPYPMLWIVTKAGELISCTINIRAGILAYARHPTDGEVEAVAVATQRTGDVIFIGVKRGEERNIEHIILEDLVNTDFTDSHYVDAGETRIFDTPTKTIEGLQRFAGKTIRVFADGAIEPPVKVSSDGAAELQIEASKVHIGLGYNAAFSPNTKQLPANGTSMGKKRRIEKITLHLYKSLGGKAGTTEEKATQLITQRFGSYELGTAPEPFTGELEVTVSGNIDTEGKLAIMHDEPAPFTLLALVERVALLEA